MNITLEPIIMALSAWRVFGPILSGILMIFNFFGVSTNSVA